jgi:general secretion pathway protein F
LSTDQEKPIQLEHLIALTDEMAALARSGVPLERGLVNFGRDVPGQLGRLARHLAERLEAGDSLPQVLAADQSAFPQVYRTVVEAGLRANRLAAALAGLATCARRLAELRRSIGLAMLYPLTVALLASGLMVFFVTQLAPAYHQAYASLRLEPDRLLDIMVSAAPWAPVWGTAIPLCLVAAAAVWWWASSRALLVESAGWTLVLGWAPGVGKLLLETRIALFSEILALLVEHETPLPDALRLAAAATGDRRTADSTKALAESIARGEPLASSVPACSPLLAWLLTVPQRQPLLATVARQTAEHYGLRARNRLEQVRLVLPVLGILCVAGVVTLCYGLALFVPWSHLLRQLG